MGFHEIKILQSTKFPISCHDVKITKHALISIGTYKPCMKIHNLQDQSLKNERNLENEPIKVEPLTEDATKIAVLRNDRYVELHAKFGNHGTYRIPSYGRNIQYNGINADLLTQSDNEVHFFNLEEGRFKNVISHDNIVNMHLSPVNSILAVACSDKIVFYDNRSAKYITEFLCKDVKCVHFSQNGINFAFNDKSIVKEMDLRMNNESYSVPCKEEINKIRYNNQIICASGDNTLDLILNGEIRWNISLNDINTFTFDGNIIFIGCENGLIKTFHNPEIENDPEWCRSVDLLSSRISQTN